jgi:hypothetical protein
VAGKIQMQEARADNKGPIKIQMITVEKKNNKFIK